MRSVEPVCQMTGKNGNKDDSCRYKGKLLGNREIKKTLEEIEKQAWRRSQQTKIDIERQKLKINLIAKLPRAKEKKI